jgi:hypothetical protein
MEAMHQSVSILQEAIKRILKNRGIVGSFLHFCKEKAEGLPVMQALDFGEVILGHWLAILQHPRQDEIQQSVQRLGAEHGLSHHF